MTDEIRPAPGGTLLAIQPGTPIDREAIRASAIINPGEWRGTARMFAGSVAVISIDGPMWGTDAYGWYGREIARVIEEGQAQSIILDIDSPGGAFHGCGELADLIARMSATLPIYAHVTGRACSAAYLIAASTRAIWASESAELGCLGAMIEWIDDTDWQEKTGIRYRYLQSSQTPGKVLDLSTPEGEARMQTRLDESAEIFIGAVARHRGVSTESILSEYGAGDTYLAAEAVRRGMAERIGTLAEMIETISRGGLMIKAKGVQAGQLYRAAVDDELEPYTLDETAVAASDAGRALVAAAAQAAEAKTKADTDQAVQAAVSAERARCVALRDMLTEGTEKMIGDAIASGASAADVAIEIVKAQKSAGVTLSGMRADAPAAAGHSGGGAVQAATGWDQSVARLSKARK